MEKGERTIYYDRQLDIEAYQFKGIVQAFPNHFHNYYVTGLVEKGLRNMQCKNKEYNIKQGDIMLFNPYDNHGCIQNDGGVFDYIGLNIQKETMLSVIEEITGEKKLYIFSENVVQNAEARYYLSSLYKMIINGEEELKKEEMFLFLIQSLTEQYGKVFVNCPDSCISGVEKACIFMQQNFGRHITLEQLCKCSNLSKATLLRAFTKSKGVTPYRYLQAVRIGKAKKLLEKGISPVETALQTGFTDQSHFSHFFNMFTGLSPAMYRNIFK